MTPRRRELIVADTTFMSVWRTSSSASSVTRRWPEPAIRRIAAATLSISVVTVAELRAGHLNAGWGLRRRHDEERWLRQFGLHGVGRCG